MGTDYAELDSKIEKILDEADRMFIATSVGGNSSGASVFFARDGSDLVFFTFHPTRKAEQIRVNPKVACVIWPKGQEGIRGLQIDGECRPIRNPEEMKRAHDMILGVTTAFQPYMDDEFLLKNKVVGYYRIKPTTIKFVDFYAPEQFEWREYPENQVPAVKDFLRSIGRRLLLWVRAVRAPFFTAAIVPILLGAVIAYGDLNGAGLAAQWDWGLFFLALIGGVLAHAGTNMANDYGDHTSRADEWNKVPSPFNGGSRMIQAGLMAPWKVLFGALLCFGGVIAIGLILNNRIGGAPLANTPLLWAGIIGIAFGILYTLTPVRLGYRGLGEPAIALGFGPVMVLGTHYVLTAGHTAPWAWQKPLLASIPVALFVMLIVWINQFQDAPFDKAAGKRTWVVRTADTGDAFFRYERPFRLYAIFNYFSFGFIAVLGLLGAVRPSLGTPFALLALIPGILAFKAIGWGRRWLLAWNSPDADRQRVPYELLKVNVSTIGVHFTTGLLLVLGYWINARFF